MVKLQWRQPLRKSLQQSLRIIRQWRRLLLKQRFQ
jgi:hypothetical protein